VTARQIILSKIDTLRSAASTARCDKMAKEEHVNYAVSDVPVLAGTDPTTGRGWYGQVLAASDIASEVLVFVTQNIAPQCAPLLSSWPNFFPNAGFFLELSRPRLYIDRMDFDIRAHRDERGE
jgi:hypothetical protein